MVRLHHNYTHSERNVILFVVNGTHMSHVNKQHLREVPIETLENGETTT